MNTVYLGRDNAFAVGLLARNVPISAAAFTRKVLYMTAPDGTIVQVDSATAPTAFDTSQPGFLYNASVPVLRMKLGLGAFSLVAGTIYDCYLRLYDAINVNGLVWPEDNQRIQVRVLSGP